MSFTDFKKKQTDGTLSIKYYTKYNCEENENFKVLSIIEYNTNMGKGRNFKYKKFLRYLKTLIGFILYEKVEI